MAARIVSGRLLCVNFSFAFTAGPNCANYVALLHDISGPQMLPGRHRWPADAVRARAAAMPGDIDGPQMPLAPSNGGACGGATGSRRPSRSRAWWLVRGVR